MRIDHNRCSLSTLNLIARIGWKCFPKMMKILFRLNLQTSYYEYGILKPERLFSVVGDPCWAQKKCRGPQQTLQTFFRGSVPWKQLLAIGLIFIYCGFGNGSSLPSGWATESPRASSEQSPTDWSNRQGDPVIGKAAKPVEVVWYSLDQHQSPCNTKKILYMDWDWITEPTNIICVCFVPTAL